MILNLFNKVQNSLRVMNCPFYIENKHSHWRLETLERGNWKSEVECTNTASFKPKS
jgi:hypothetical protein